MGRTTATLMPRAPTPLARSHAAVTLAIRVTVWHAWIVTSARMGHTTATLMRPAPTPLDRSAVRVRLATLAMV